MALFNSWFSKFLKTWHWLFWAGESSGQHTSTWRAPRSHHSVLVSLCSGHNRLLAPSTPQLSFHSGLRHVLFPLPENSSRRSSLTLLHSSAQKWPSIPWPPSYAALLLLSIPLHGCAFPSRFIIIWYFAYLICSLWDSSTFQQNVSPEGRSLSHLSLLQPCGLEQPLACGRIYKFSVMQMQEWA